MSALPQSFMRPVGYDLTEFVPIDVACKILDSDDGSLRRICRENLRLTGSAILTTPPEGGQEKWFIHRSYDLRLQSPKEIARLTESDLSAFSEKQRKVALAKRCCIERFRYARQHARGDWKVIVRTLIDELKKQFPFLKISRSSLFRWDKEFQNPCDLIKLVDHRGGDNVPQASPEAWHFLRGIYLVDNQPKKRRCWKLTGIESEARGWQWISYQACCRNFYDHISRQEESYHRTPAAFRTKLAPYIEQDMDSWAGENWVSDHKQLDVICSFGNSLIRPFLTAWMDWRTRKIVGFILSAQANSNTILAGLRMGMLDPSNMGGPAHVWLDNGRDYCARMFHAQTKTEFRRNIKIRLDEGEVQGIFSLAGIDAHFSIPFNPNGKARLERKFLDFNSFTDQFPTSTGPDADHKPEGLSERLKNPRLIPSFEEINSRLKDFVAGMNANADHQMDDLIEDGVRLSPNEAFAKWVKVKRVMADPKSLDLLLAHWHKPLTVGRNGIAINICGRKLRYGQFSPELAGFKAARLKDRKPVMVAYDPNDLSAIRVHDARWQFVCVAPLNQLGGAHGTKIAQRHVADLNRQKAQYNRAIKHISDPANSLTKLLTNEEIIAQNAMAERERNRAAERIDPPALKIIQTPLDGVSKEMERDQLRAAVGAESQSVAPHSAESILAGMRGRIAPRSRDEAVPDALEKLREKNHEW